MEGQALQKPYRTPYKYLRIGEREYAVLDKSLAAERSAYHLAVAKRLSTESPNQHELINKELILATDFGSKEAPFLFAQRMLSHDIPTQYPTEDVVVFLKIAAERGYAEAAYRMGCCYAGLSLFSDIEEAANDYFDSFNAQERYSLAEYYFDKAIEKDHQNAIEQLIMAYAYGRGYIKKNIKEFTKLCDAQCLKQNQNILLAYGALLLGMNVENKDFPMHAEVPIDITKGMKNLLDASRGRDLAKAEHALNLVCICLEQPRWNDEDKRELKHKIIADAINGNQLLALYLAWYCIPLGQRNTISHGLFERYQLNALAMLVNDDGQDALAYLDIALCGEDDDISTVAKEILSRVFGQSLGLID